MLLKMRCRVCDAESLVIDPTRAADDELVCDQCAASYEALLAEITAKSHNEDVAADSGTEAVTQHASNLPEPAPEGERATADQSHVEAADKVDASLECHPLDDGPLIDGPRTDRGSPPAEADETSGGVFLYRARPTTLALGAACLLTLVCGLAWVRPANKAELVSHAQAIAEPAAVQEAVPVVASHATEAADATEPGESPESVKADAEIAAREEAQFADPDAPAPEPAPVPAEDAQPEPIAAATAAETQAHNASPSGAFAVQVGSHNDASEANEQAARLRAAGFEARVAAVEIPRKGTWYRVQSGGFASREEAAQYEKRLRVSGASSTTFVTQSQD